MKLVRCGYPEYDSDAYDICCLREAYGERAFFPCEVYSGLECPYGKEFETCDTCAHAGDMSLDHDGNRIVNCGINEMQMFSPFAYECKHWERADKQ